MFSVIPQIFPGIDANIPGDDRSRLRIQACRLSDPEYYKRWMSLVLPAIGYFGHDSGIHIIIYGSDGRKVVENTSVAGEGHTILTYDDNFVFRRIKADRSIATPATFTSDDGDGEVEFGGQTASVGARVDRHDYLFERLAKDDRNAEACQLLLMFEQWVDDRRRDLRMAISKLDAEHDQAMASEIEGWEQPDMENSQ